MKYSALLGAAACCALAACGSDPAAPADEGQARSAETPRLVFVFENLDATGAPEDAEVRAILHNADTGAVVHDINLSETGGVADFGEMAEGETSTVSFVVKDGDSAFEAYTFTEVAVGTYELPVAQSDCEDTVSIDVTVDASASSAATAAGATAFADEFILEGSEEPQTSWLFTDLAGCQSLGQLLAFTLADGRPDLYGYQSDLALEEGGEYAIAVDTMPATLTLTAGERALEAAYLLTYINGDFTGLVDAVTAEGENQALRGAFDVAGGQVQPGVVALNDEGTIQWVRQAPVQDAADTIDLALWETELTLGEFDAATSTQPYSFAAPAAAHVASAEFVHVDADAGVTWVWTLYVPASAQQVVAPAMPGDIEDLIVRDQLGDDLADFELRRFDDFANYAGWLQHTLTTTGSGDLLAYSSASPYADTADGGSSDGGGGFCIPEIIPTTGEQCF